MGRIAVYSEPIRRWYTASPCSIACFTQLVLWTLNIVLPLIVAYSIPGFWQKYGQYREQPFVQFQHQALVSVSSSAGQIATWSTMPNYNRLAASQLRIPLVTSYSVDSNYDGKPDAFNITVQMPVTAGERVQQVQLMLFVSYQLSLFSRLQVQGMAYVDESSPFSVSRLDYGGDLFLLQQNPLPWTGVVTTSNSSIVNQASFLAKDYNILTILQNYAKRNETTQLRNSYKMWTTRGANELQFTAQLYIRFPEQTLTYRTGFWQLIKFAWIQYLSVFLVFLWLLGGVRRFIFANGLVSSARKDL